MKNNLITVIIFATVTICTTMRLTTQDPTELQCGLTQHFNDFLANSEYKDWGFNRSQIPCGSFGGKSSDSDKPIHNPVVFIHDNDDIAFGRGNIDGYSTWQTGFRALVNQLIQKGNYTQSELYTTTYQTFNTTGNDNYVRLVDLNRTRNFIRAVIDYTGMPVNIIAHGMGVTVGRKAIKGRTGTDHVFGTYNLGDSISKYIKNFIGLAGYNYGLIGCAPGPIYAFCNNKDGFYPGTIIGGLCEMLSQLNDGLPEAENTYTIWSANDQRIGVGSLVFSKVTCRIPNQRGQIKKSGIQWTHDGIRDLTGDDILNWLSFH